MQPQEPCDELLSAYLDEELDAAARQQVEERLRDDPSARRLLNDLRGAVEAVRSLPRGRAPAGVAEAVRSRLEQRASAEAVGASAPGVAGTRVSTGRWWRGLAYAAVVVMTVSVGYVSLRHTSEPPSAGAPEAVGEIAMVPTEKSIADGFASRQSAVDATASDDAMESELSRGRPAADERLLAPAYFSSDTELPAARKMREAPEAAPRAARTGAAAWDEDSENRDRSAAARRIDRQAAETAEAAVTARGMLPRTDAPALGNQMVLKYTDRAAADGAMTEIQKQVARLGVPELQVGADAVAGLTASRGWRQWSSRGGPHESSDRIEQTIYVAAPPEELARLVHNLGQTRAAINSQIEFALTGQVVRNWPDTLRLATMWPEQVGAAAHGGAEGALEGMRSGMSDGDGVSLDLTDRAGKSRGRRRASAAENLSRDGHVEIAKGVMQKKVPSKDADTEPRKKLSKASRSRAGRKGSVGETATPRPHRRSVSPPAAATRPHQDAAFGRRADLPGVRNALLVITVQAPRASASSRPMIRKARR